MSGSFFIISGYMLKYQQPMSFCYYLILIKIDTL